MAGMICRDLAPWRFEVGERANSKQAGENDRGAQGKQQLVKRF